MGNIKIDYIAEPNLRFGHYFEHEDPKIGLYDFGPYGLNVKGLHVNEIKVGIIGTRETISNTVEWLNKCSSYIESENIKKSKSRNSDNETNLLFPNDNSLTTERDIIDKNVDYDFVGFNKDSSFECEFIPNERWQRSLNSREISRILDNDNKYSRINEIVELINSNLSSILEVGPKPDLVIIALTKEIVEKADTVKVHGNYYYNLRRVLKAKAMMQRNPVPIQIMQHGTLTGKRKSLQDISTRAWNFCVAQYYKAGGVPWIPTELESNTCYIGINFYVDKESDELSNNTTIRSSIASAFDYLGQGVILRGEKFEWDSESLGGTPHLKTKLASKLIKKALDEYLKATQIPPKRVVLFKSSKFWGKEHEDFNEIEGFYEGIDDVYPGIQTDFVVLKQTGIRFFREGNYPPLRGTHINLGNGGKHLLYTMGMIPHFRKYIKGYVPEPWELVQHIGESAPRDIFRDVLSLTKMNVNNCEFTDGVPITLSFAHKVGEILKHIPEGESVQPEYKYYI
ncbi:hypothetical protein ACG2F4_06865 [Halalkalibaculum sp. DA3122]|uniref:argonaute/piwi family protein n=1 Tax=Halalkalibaculum sp. DA3122 TaxID=3373607 RepID=UPI0037546600